MAKKAKKKGGRDSVVVTSKVKAFVRAGKMICAGDLAEAVDGKVRLGRGPEGFVPPSRTGKGPFLMAPRLVQLSVPQYGDGGSNLRDERGEANQLEPTRYLPHSICIGCYRICLSTDPPLP